MSLPLIVAFWSKILHLSQISTKSNRNSKFAHDQFWDKWDICHSELSKPCHCISNVTAIDYNILVYNFTFKVKYRQNWRVIPSLLAINFGICEIFAILYYLNLDTCIDNVSAIDCSILVQNFTFKVKYRQNQREIPSLLMINFGISEIFTILNYPNLVICISNVTAIDYNILVYNFTFKVKYRQNQIGIPSLLMITFGISEIFAILNYPNLVICISNVTAIDYNLFGL